MPDPLYGRVVSNQDKGTHDLSKSYSSKRLTILRPRLIVRYPPNANRPRFRRMVKPTLRMMLRTIQNRYPLPNEGGSPSGHLHLEHHVIRNGFQITHGSKLALRPSLL